MSAQALRISVALVAVVFLGPSVAADPHELTGEVCVERIVVNGSCNNAEAWEANLDQDLNRPYREMDVHLDTAFECREVEVPRELMGQLVIVQGFALERGTLEVEGGEDEVIETIQIAKDESAAVAARGLRSTGRVALVGDSALIFDSEVTSKVPGITVTSAPQLDFTCDLNEIEAAFLAKESGVEWL